MRLPLRGLYAITPDGMDGAALRARISSYAAGGGRWLQYRDKAANRSQRQERAAQAAEFCKLHGVALIVNDDLELALEIGAEGVHLGGTDGDLAAARQRLGPERILGVSCYNEPARAVAARDCGADYVALGAVYASATKPAAVRAPLALIGEVRRAVGLPVVAIGGITLDNAPAVIVAGADMLAVVSDLFDAPDLTTRTASYQKLFD